MSLVLAEKLSSPFTHNGILVVRRRRGKLAECT